MYSIFKYIKHKLLNIFSLSAKKLMISEDLNDIDYRNIIIYDPIKNSIINAK